MRLWTLHPENLDRMGLLAVWREGLLAQAVLAGKTKGYLKHPQLERFRAEKDPLLAIGHYLSIIQKEASFRGYSFDAKKIVKSGFPGGAISVSRGQIEYEIAHLKGKVSKRSPGDLARISGRISPVFRQVQREIKKPSKIPIKTIRAAAPRRSIAEFTTRDSEGFMRLVLSSGASIEKTFENSAERSPPENAPT